MKLNRKILTLLCLVPMAFTTACSNTGFKHGDPNTDKIDVTMDTRGVTIQMWTGFGSKISESLADILEEFEAITGIHVEHESKGGYPNLLKAINLASTSGKYPHVANGYPDHFASYVKSNVLLRLDGLIANDPQRKNYTQNGIDYDAEGMQLLDYDDFYTDYTVENETLEYNEEGVGYKLGLPFNKSTEVMVYNSTFFDWVATQDSLKSSIYVPKTWAQVKSVGTAVNALFEGHFNTEAGKGHILASDGNFYSDLTAAQAAKADNKLVFDLTNVEQSKFRAFTYDSTANLFITLVRQYGATFTEVDKTKTGKGYVRFMEGENRAKTVAAMTMLKDLFDSNIMGIPSMYGELYCSTPFKAYQSLMNVGSSAGLSNSVNTEFKVKCTTIPYNDAEGGHKAVISQGTSIGLLDKGTDKEKLAAWKLMIYLSQQANGLFAASTGYYPTCDISYNSEDYQNYLYTPVKTDTAKLEQMSANVNNTEYNGETDPWNKFVDPGFRGSADIRETVDLVPGYLYTGEKGTAEQTLEFIWSTLDMYVE